MLNTNRENISRAHIYSAFVPDVSVIVPLMKMVNLKRCALYVPIVHEIARCIFMKSN